MMLMEIKEFEKIISTKGDYGLCPPPIEAQEGLNILIKHFLGKDWYVTLPISQEQLNTEAIYEILSKHPKKKSLKEMFNKD